MPRPVVPFVLELGTWTVGTLPEARTLANRRPGAKPHNDGTSRRARAERPPPNLDRMADRPRNVKVGEYIAGLARQPYWDV
ncbi:hypothetical protein [Nocardia carnea]|uniref:hypothetical protein n=1 Tax=Nocardia carnea TaxID=37328 RepID=UPI0024578163|nr:hypothetical protein [Nocardia carnea]